MAVIDGKVRADKIRGTDDPDTISGRDSGDTLYGGGGDDVVYGFGSVDEDPESGVINAEQIITGLDRSLAAGAAPGQPDLLFVAEQHTGVVRIIDLNTNTVLPTPFLDIPDDEITTGNEQGLLGIAFHPKYESNGKFYVDLTNADGDIEVWQYKRSESDPLQIDAESKKLVIRIDHPPALNHNGGFIGFGPDNYLYLSVGDGGGAGDPGDDGQNPNSLLGKILRIDVRGDDFVGDDTKNYSIPADNPFIGTGAGEVWHMGLRNPWRVSFDSLTGDMYIGDVGQAAHEEIDYVAAGVGGLNFGWNFREGLFPFEGGADDPSFTNPIIDVPHTEGPFSGNVIIGGQVYRGPGGGQGLYFFSDLGSDNFWTTRVVDGVATQYVNINDYLRVDTGSLGSVVSYALDGTGRLYSINLSGEVYRITPSEAAGDAADTVYGGLGNDTLWGGAGDDVLNGGANDDTLNGGLGSDTASYDRAAAGVTVSLKIGLPQDTLGAGIDGLDAIENLEGSRFADSLTGEGGNNTLSGGKGDDLLHGGAGIDVLIGGRGGDEMNSGHDGDIFVYLDVTDSHGQHADNIVGLSEFDTIDLSAIDADTTQADDQAFVLAGSSFSGQAGELVLVFDGTGTLLKGDVDGDAKADLLVLLPGDQTAFANFVL